MDELRARVPQRDELFLEDTLNGPAELTAVVAAQRAATARIPAEALALPRRRLIGMGTVVGPAREKADVEVQVAEDPGDWAVGTLVASAVGELVAAGLWARTEGRLLPGDG